MLERWLYLSLMRTRCLLLALCYCLYGCIAPKTPARLTRDLSPEFVNRFGGGNTGLSEKLDLNGIYQYSWRSPQRLDTTRIQLLFYVDGTFRNNLHLAPGNSSFKDYFNEVKETGRDHKFYNQGDWGIYTLSGDTIKAQYLSFPYRSVPTDAGEEWYVITSKTSLRMILRNWDILDHPNTNLIRQHEFVKEVSSLEFIPIDNIPPPLPWIKTRKFFWRYEQDWMKYNEDPKDKARLKN